MIRINGLTKAFGGNGVLSGVDLEVKQGEIVTIIGPSGAGKTTLLRTLNWLDVPDGGTIQIDDAFIDAANATKKRIRQLRSKTAMVFQHYNLFNNKTALENVTESLILVRKLPKAAAIQTGKHLLDRVGLSDKMKTSPNLLSGGEQQRVAIARAIVGDPALIVADEPTGNLDSETARTVMDLFGELHRSGKTILLVTHDEEVARRASVRYRMHDGLLINGNDTNG